MHPAPSNPMENPTFCLILSLGIGALSAFLIRDDLSLYGTLSLPPFAPPAIVFPIIWSILYLLMGIASYLVLTSGCQPHARANALYIYFLQLGINAVWPILFFKLGALAFAFIWCILLSIAVFLTLIFFFFAKNFCHPYAPLFFLGAFCSIAEL